MKKKIQEIINNSNEFNKDYNEIRYKIDTNQYILSKKDAFIKRFNFKFASAICLILMIFAFLSIILVNNIQVVSKIIDELKGETKNPVQEQPKYLYEVMDSIELYDEFYISHIDSKNVSINLYKTEYNKLIDSINYIYTLDIENILNREEFINIKYQEHIRLIINDKENNDNQIILYIYNQSGSYNLLFVYNKKSNKYYYIDINNNELNLFIDKINSFNLEKDERFQKVLKENFETQIIKTKDENLKIEIIDTIGANKDIYIIRSNYIKEGNYFNNINNIIFKDNNNPNAIYIWKNDIIYSLQEAINNNIISEYQLKLIQYNFHYKINEQYINSLISKENIINYLGVFGEDNAIALSINNKNVEKIQYVLGIEINNYFNTEVIIYYNNKIYTINEAYNEKIINYKNIQEIAYIYNPNKELLSNIYSWINTLEANNIEKIELVTVYNTLPNQRKETITINTKEQIESIIIELQETYYYTPNSYIINNQNEPSVGGYSSRVLYIYTNDGNVYNLNSDGNFNLPTISNN